MSHHTDTVDIALGDCDVTLTTADGSPVPYLPVGYLRIEAEYETVYTDRPVRRPDDQWTLTHPGCIHAHRWLTVEENVQHTGAEKPRMIWFAHRETRHVDCDGTCGMGDCGGYDVTWWRCPVTDTEIVPGTVEGPRHATIQHGMMAHLTVETRQWDLPEDRVLGEEWVLTARSPAGDMAIRLRSPMAGTRLIEPGRVTVEVSGATDGYTLTQR